MRAVPRRPEEDAEIMAAVYARVGETAPAAVLAGWEQAADGQERSAFGCTWRWLARANCWRRIA